MKNNILKVLSVLLIAVCIVINIGFLYINGLAPEKIESKTFHVDLQTITNEDGTTQTKPFIEIQYFKNENNNGRRVFEVKFNYLLDETKTAFYSQGLQFAGSKPIDIFNSLDNDLSSGGFNLDLIYKSESEPTFVWESKEGTWRYNRYFNQKVSNSDLKNVNKYNYASADDYETTITSSNPLNSESTFKIEIGDDIFGMKLKYDDFYFENLDMDSLNYVETYETVTSAGFLDTIKCYDTYYRWASIDYNLFSKILFESVKDMPAGTEQYTRFEFGDLFNYYLYDENSKTYSEKTVDPATHSNVVKNIKSYYTIKINISKDGLKSSNESLFKMVEGSANFNQDYATETDYRIDRNVYCLTLEDLKPIATSIPGEYLFDVSDNFKSYYIEHKDKMQLDIQIDLDYLKQSNIEFAGLAIKDFKVIELTTIETINGYVVEKEVKL